MQGPVQVAVIDDNFVHGKLHTLSELILAVIGRGGSAGLTAPGKKWQDMSTVAQGRRGTVHGADTSRLCAAALGRSSALPETMVSGRSMMPASSEAWARISAWL